MTSAQWIATTWLVTAALPTFGGSASILPPTEVGANYSTSVARTGETASAFQIASGVLPQGLVLDSSGRILGSPTRRGNSRFSISALSESGTTFTNSYKVIVYSAVSIVTTQLSSGKGSAAVLTKLKAKGGRKPYHWSTQGSLSPGLCLDEATGVIRGTPIPAGDPELTVRVADSAGGNAFQAFVCPEQPGIPWFSLGPAAQYSVSNYDGGATAIGDINGDGSNDVVFVPGANSPHEVLIYRQNSQGSLDAPEILPTDIDLRGVAIADVNHDGKADLLVCGNALFPLVGYWGRLAIFYQDPATGQLLPPQEFTVSSFNVRCMTVGDLNSDGLIDIAVGAEWTIDPDHGVLSVFYQNSDGTLGSELVYSHVPTALIIRIADMDHDGHNDLVLATGLKQFTIVRQDATTLPGVLSTNATAYDVTTSYWPYYSALEVADVNGDGWPDVVTLDPGNNGYLSIYRQNAQEGLNPPERLVPWDAPPFGIEIADINGDGLNDILGDRSGAVDVLFQSTVHCFSTPVSYYFPTFSFGGSAFTDALSIGDATGDGRPDAVVNWSNEGLYVLPNYLQVPEP